MYSLNFFFLCIVKSDLVKIMGGGKFDKRGGKSRMRVSDGPTDHYPKTVSSVMVSGASEYQGTVKGMRDLFYFNLIYFIFPDWGNTPQR